MANCMVMTGRRIRRIAGVLLAAAVVLVVPTVTAAPADALNLPQVPVVKNNFSLVAIGIVVVSLLPGVIAWLRAPRRAAP